MVITATTLSIIGVLRGVFILEVTKVSEVGSIWPDRNCSFGTQGTSNLVHDPFCKQTLSNVAELLPAMRAQH